MSDITLPFTVPQHVRHIQSAQATSIHVLYIGDSTSQRVVESSPQRDAIVSALSDSGVTATVTNAAQGGSTLLKANDDTYYWYDEDENTIDVEGTQYRFKVADLDNFDDITDIVCALPLNDILGPDTEDKATIKAAFLDMFAELKSLMPALDRIFIRPLMRQNIASVTSAYYDEWDNIRDAIYEIIDEVDYVHQGPELYDSTMADGWHQTDAYELIAGQRDAGRLAYVAKGSGLPFLGMKVTGVEVRDDGLHCTVMHHDGNDWTCPADTTDFLKTIAIYRAGERLSSITGDLITKDSATAFTIACNPITDASMKVLHGPLHDLGSEDVATNLPYDNSDAELPFGRSTPTITYADPLLGLTGIDVACKPSFTKTYSSGTLIDTVTSVNEDTWSPNDTSNRTEYDATAFGGVGGFVSSGQAYRLEVNELLAEQFLYMCVIDVPASPTDDINVLEFGVSGTPGIYNRTYIDDADGHLKHRAREGSTGTGTISAVDYRGQTLVMIVNARTQDAWDFYINSDTVTATFDVNNNYTGRTNVYWGGGDATYGAMYLRIGEDHGKSGDLSITQIKAQLESAHNIT